MNAFTLTNPAVEAAVSDSGSPRNFGQVKRLAIPFKKDVFRGVASLLHVSSPFAVIWRVISGSVNSVDRVPLARSRPHVGVKVLELLPSLANGYSTRAVQVVHAGVRVLAPLFHPCPNLKFIGIAHPMRVRSARGFTLPASAGLCCSAPKVGQVSGYCVPAIAFTEKGPIRFLAGVFLQKHESVEAFPDHFQPHS